MGTTETTHRTMPPLRPTCTYADKPDPMSSKPPYGLTPARAEVLGFGPFCFCGFFWNLCSDLTGLAGPTGKACIVCMNAMSCAGNAATTDCVPLRACGAETAASATQKAFKQAVALWLRCEEAKVTYCNPHTAADLTPSKEGLLA